LQNLTKEARAAACQSFAVDVDIANSIPSILVKLAGGLNLLDTCPFLCKYVANYEVWRLFLMDLYDETLDNVKVMILRCFFFGLPHDDNPMLWALCNDMYILGQHLLEDDKFSYLNGMFSTRRNPLASRIAYLGFGIEDSVIEELRMQCASPCLIFL
jgi:hypothetical protein